MKIALLGTGFGQAHAAVYAHRPDVTDVVVFGRTPAKLEKFADDFGFATTTDLDALITDPSVDLVDICLPTHLHADTAIRAMQAGKNVLIELPLATTMDDAQRVIDTQHTTGRRAFVDMFSRFSPANAHLREAAEDQRYGALLSLETESRTALLWPGYDLALGSLAMDVMHADFDLVTSLLGAPDTVHVTGTEGPGGRGSAADVILGYPNATARCSASSLMPKPYAMRGGYRATFTGAVLEHVTTAGPTGQGISTLTAHSADGEHTINLPDTHTYTQVIEHVLACLDGREESRIDPTSALGALRLTLDVHDELTATRAAHQS
ncbi:Gfo/Idh/MocA family protein [Streptomyces sp. NPDC058623]|uniref:Gfo/Idh/MocA family protein n=1 Tax=Streptomyces sp. NPDC058623 TaxID=3346563 RepID=UPI0036513F8E